ncbi:MAG: HEAT repeat domain-containing protein [Rubripirellula sp.]|nr:HEAT repeat domain-containing protein [Rubripirellula sp.]
MTRLAIVAALTFGMAFIPTMAQDTPKPKVEFDVLNLIPMQASAALAIRDIRELKVRGDELFRAVKVKSPTRFSQFFEMLFSFLGLTGTVDDEGTFVLLTSSDQVDSYDAFAKLVLGVPIKDVDAFAKSLGIPRERLDSGEVLAIRDLPKTRSSKITSINYLAVRGKHAFMGLEKATVEDVMTQPSLGNRLGAEAKATIRNDDVVFFVAEGLIKNMVSSENESIQRFTNLFVGQEDAETKELFLQEFQWILGGIRLDGGIGTTIMVEFEGEQSHDLLTRLGKGNSQANLNGLPSGSILAAQSLCTRGTEMASSARSLFRFALEQILTESGGVLAADRLSNLSNLFGLSLQNCEQTRFALYENTDPVRTGWFSLVAILDTEEPEQFVKELVDLAPFMHASGLTVTDRKETLSPEVIETLVEDLGNSSFRVRRLAATKLGLIGPPAIKALKAAGTSQDIEVRTRSESILVDIQRGLASERKALLEKDLLSRLRPQLTFLANQETRTDRPVDFVRLGFRGKSGRLAAQLKRLLGPEWHTIRVATVGNQVILLIGSELQLFDNALAIAQKPDGEKRFLEQFKNFEERSPMQRSAEMHFSLRRLEQLIDPNIDPTQRPDEAKGISSVDVQINPQQIRVDAFMPHEELSVLIEKTGF